ncbi:Cysteine-rich receptor-like protein kinase 10 [Linum grandiflorum]
MSAAAANAIQLSAAAANAIQLSAAAANAVSSAVVEIQEKGSRTIAKLVTPVALVITPVTLVLLLILGIYYCFFLRKHRGRKDDDSSSETLLIPFAILREATCNFSEANKLGQGGFGAVYKWLHAPVYVNNGIFSTKSDVYSFGILILEIVSGDSISSPRDYSNLQIDKVAAKRPTMSSIVLMLSSNTPTFSSPSKPGFFARNEEKGSRTIAKLVTPVALVITPVTLVLLLILGIYYCFFLRKHRGRKDDDSSSETLLIPFAILREATCNFSEANKLGQGGFGAVYKGKMSDGKEVAVKRQLTSSSQGMEEVKTEVTLVAKLEHTNLVRLLGFCIQGKERLLVYEYLPNGSLDQVLFGNTTLKKSKLNWETRYRIIVGIARGMQYLHEDSRLNIIHRDLKGGNILLDESMNPKISDFGTARLFSGTQTHINTGRVLGTRGYMSPEYVNNGIFSTKSDVYSFGILILEIVSGDRISSPRNYSNLQSDHWMNGRALDLLDRTLRGKYSGHEAMKCIHVGLLCVQKVAAKRPTMSSIVLMLSSNTSTFSPLSKPGFFVRNEGSMSDSDMEEESVQPSINDVTITDLSARW